jgi:hypothetical protein
VKDSLVVEMNTKASAAIYDAPICGSFIWGYLSGYWLNCDHSKLFIVIALYKNSWLLK